MTSHPDIVLLVLDTQRVDRLSCYGYTRETTPHIDKFAADATLFAHAYATAQWTIPSHASMFTGLYPDQHNMLHASSILQPGITTLAERLSDTGYFSAAFCNNPLLGVVNTGLQRGFHSFLNYSGWMTSRPHQSGRERTLFDRYRQHFKHLLANSITAMQDIFARSDALLDLSFSPLMAPLWQTALSFKGNTAKSLNDAARLHIERKGIAQGQPIFSFINLMGTHMPYHPPSRFIERFAPQFKQSRVERHYLHQFNSDVFGWLAPLTNALSKENKALLDDMYDAEVANQDEFVGTFIDRLRASGVLDRTLFIICADHGEHLGEKQLMGHSISLYNTLVHVPLIVRSPGNSFSESATVDRVVSTRRIFQTIVTAAECATENEQALNLTRSGPSDPEHEHIFAVGITPQNLLNIMRRRRPELVQSCEQPRYAIWNERYKFIQTGETMSELYDVLDDPAESVNLRDILPERVEALQEQLHGFIKHSSPVSVPEEEIEAYNEPQVYRRLHDLGYLE